MRFQFATRGIGRSLVLVALGSGALSTSLGCTVAAGGPAENVSSTGTLQLALNARSNSGTNYHLANATFNVTGTTSDTLSGDDAVLRADLPAGSYAIQLVDGWTLSSVAADGTETPVPAQLVSDNPQSLTIQNQTITHVSFSFQVQGETIQTGDGRVSVALNVDDGLIDDFEADDTGILQIAGRNGGWFEFTDGTNGVITPAPSDPLLPTPDGPNGDLVLHVFGGGFTGFGAGVGTSLLFNGRVGAYNAAAYAGIRFKYTSESWIRLNVGTVATTALPDGSCDPSTQVCFDDFGVFLPPTDQFTSVEFRWSDLSQMGFGTPATFDASQLLTLKWGFPGATPLLPFPPITSFDLRLDDIAFVPSTPDATSCVPELAACDPRAPSCCKGLFCDPFGDICLE